LWLISPDNHKEKTDEQIADAENNIKGLLSDVAPTILDIMGIEKPSSMNGESLLNQLK